MVDLNCSDMYRRDTAEHRHGATVISLYIICPCTRSCCPVLSGEYGNSHSVHCFFLGVEIYCIITTALWSRRAAAEYAAFVAVAWNLARRSRSTRSENRFQKNLDEF